jgi:hypothetical protein
MPYVLRDARGQIDRIHRDAVPGAEFLPPEHPELLQMLGGSAKGASFAHLDTGLIRVLEDLVDVLVSNNVICITDLPAEAQQKLFARKNFRDRFQRNALHLGAPETPLGHDSVIPTVAMPVAPPRAKRQG